LRVVFVIREDYIAQLDPFAPLLPEGLRTRFRLERLREADALSAVTGPLRDTKRSFAEGVAEQLVEELLKVRLETVAGEIIEATGEFVEPVQLQVVCQSLWRGLPPDVTVITREHLQAFGDVNQALLGFYERAIKRTVRKVDIRERGLWKLKISTHPLLRAFKAYAEERDLRDWFEYDLITPAGTRGTVYRGGEETGGIPNAGVDVLEDLHLIRGERRAGARWYQLTHDRFIEPILRSNNVWQRARYRRYRRLYLILSTIRLLVGGVVVYLLFTRSLWFRKRMVALVFASYSTLGMDIYFYYSTRFYRRLRSRRIQRK